MYSKNSPTSQSSTWEHCVLIWTAAFGTIDIHCQEHHLWWNKEVGKIWILPSRYCNWWVTGFKKQMAWHKTCRGNDRKESDGNRNTVLFAGWRHKKRIGKEQFEAITLWVTSLRGVENPLHGEPCFSLCWAPCQSHSAACQVQTPSGGFQVSKRCQDLRFKWSNEWSKEMRQRSLSDQVMISKTRCWGGGNRSNES